MYVRVEAYVRHRAIGPSDRALNGKENVRGGLEEMSPVLSLVRARMRPTKQAYGRQVVFNGQWHSLR